MPNCATPGCTASGVYLFPKDETLKKKWEEAVSLEKYVDIQNSRLCRYHFDHFHESKYVGESANTGNPQISNYLKEEAVPSIFSLSTESPTPTSTNVCRVCLAIDVKMYDMKNFKLSEMFENVTGILDSDDKANKNYHICWECAARLKAAVTFKNKALLSDTLLNDLVHVTKSDIVKLKENHIDLKSHLTVHKTSNYIEYEYSESEINNETAVKEESNTRINEEEKETENHKNESCIDLPLKIKIEFDPIPDNDVNINDGQVYEDEITNINIKPDIEMPNVLNSNSLVDMEQKPRPDDQIAIDFEIRMKEAFINKAKEENVDETPKKKYKLTNRMKEKILEMKSNGAPTRTIADQTGLSVSSIDCWWARYRRNCPIYQKNLKIKRIQQNSKHNCQYKPELFKEMETCSEKVRQRLYEAGLEHILIKKPEKNPGTVPIVSDHKSHHDNLKKRIIALKQEGITNSRIAFLLDTSPTTVRKWWARWCEKGHMQNLKATNRKKNSRKRSALETEGDI